MAPIPRPVADLVRLAELLSAHRLDEAGGTIALTPEEWAERWEDLTNRYADEFARSRPAAADAATAASTQLSSL